ncbi:hypothetical protein TSUD_305510 [Trifolium subterraneum]|uniref:Uncharacterized protein n=1 Tax=Trifolium subterraneum TaxID=3900 RepID=A0A2Z6LU86_TRISU|nr:hypothetical protein TSUD_305510 [Trifolium subterraneum]
MEWISASGRSGRRLLIAFDSSYKNWKNMFFRVRSICSSYLFFLEEGGKPRFLLHWTTDPVPYTTFEVHRLDEVERDEVQQLSCLSVFHCANLIGLNENRHALMKYFYMASKLNKKDLEKFLNLNPSTDSIDDTDTDTSVPISTMATPSGSQLKQQSGKRLAKVPAKPLPRSKRARVPPFASTSGIQRSPLATVISGDGPSSKVPSVSPTPTIVDVDFRPGMIDDGVPSSSEIDKMHSNKLKKENLFEEARVHQLQALTLMKELEQISDGLEFDKLIKENEDLKRKLEVAHKAHGKLKKEVFELNNKQKKWHMEKIDLEVSLKEERDLLKSTQVNLSEQKKRLQHIMSQESNQYLEGFKCAKSQAAFLCSVNERNLDAMRLWGRVKDGEIVVDDEVEESKDSVRLIV